MSPVTVDDLSCLALRISETWNAIKDLIVSLRNGTLAVMGRMRDSHSSFDELPGTPVNDVAAVRALLIEAARQHRVVSYSELLMELGHRFTRPKMRALCRTLDAIDEEGRHRGEPELAALVVRESDRLPGQGWWVGKVNRLGYEGPWTGKEALAFVKRRQQLAFDYWSK